MSLCISLFPLPSAIYTLELHHCSYVATVDFSINKAIWYSRILKVSQQTLHGL